MRVSLVILGLLGLGWIGWIELVCLGWDWIGLDWTLGLGQVDSAGFFLSSSVCFDSIQYVVVGWKPM